MKKITLTLIFLLMAGAAFALSQPKGNIVQIKRVRVDDAYQPNVLGLFIGIQEYDDPYWHDLKYPRKDVADMEAFFSKNETLELDKKIVLTTPRETTKDHILNNSLKDFSILNSSSKDIVIVYISSHGTLMRERMAKVQEGNDAIAPRWLPYILTSDSRETDIRETAIPIFQVIEWFESLKSQRKVLIFDMCHSGRFGKSQIGQEQLEEISSEKGIHFAEIEDSKASIILAACPIGGISYEDKTLQNSVYTHFLLEGMRAGDLNLDGAVSISEAHNFAIDKTRQFTWSKKEYKQVPTAYSRILGKDPIMVSGTPSNTGNPTLFSYENANQGVEIYLDKAYLGMLPKGVPVEPGHHKIECRVDGEVIYSETLEIDPGYDYMFPCFDIHAERRPKFLISIDAMFQRFSRHHVPEDLVPDGLLWGVSLYHYNLPKKWIALSCGIDYGVLDDVTQYSVRVGLKYTKSFGEGRLFIGPDVKALLYNYESDMIDDKQVDDYMNFFSPGMECLWVQPIRSLNLMFGIRSYYMPYKINLENQTLLSYGGFVSIGYLF